MATAAIAYRKVGYRNCMPVARFTWGAAGPMTPRPLHKGRACRHSSQLPAGQEWFPAAFRRNRYGPSGHRVKSQVHPSVAQMGRKSYELQSACQVSQFCPTRRLRHRNPWVSLSSLLRRFLGTCRRPRYRMDGKVRRPDVGAAAGAPPGTRKETPPRYPAIRKTVA